MCTETEDKAIATALNSEEQCQLNYLKSLLQEQKNVACPMDEANLLGFLRYRKNNVEEAFQAVLKYWKLFDKTRPHIKYVIPSPENFFGFSVTLKNRDKNGCQVLLWKMKRWEPSKRRLIQNFLTNFPSINTITERQLTQMNGVVFVMDLEGFGTEHALHSTPGDLKQMVEFCNGFPMQIKGIHFINNSQLFTAAWSIIKIFLKEKIKQRVYFHGHDFTTSLHEHIGPEILPKYFGGYLDDDNYGEEGFEELLLNNQEYYSDLFDVTKYGYLKKYKI